MKRRELMTGIALAPLVAAAARAADDYPSRAVTILNGYAPGGSTDVSARLLAQGLSARLGNASVIVEGKPGASGTLASESLTRQPPDGYTLMLSESSSFAIWPSMHVNGTRYKPLEDFTWVSIVCTSPLVFIVAPNFPADNVKDAMALLGSPKSTDLAFSSSGAGSIPHICAELLKHTVGPGAKSQHIPYRGGSPAVLSVSKGETAWGMATLGSAAGLIEGGMLKALAVTSPTRFSKFPNIPTFTESGVPEMELNTYYMMHGPAGLPQPIVDKLNKAGSAAVASTEWKDRFVAAGMEAWTGPNSPADARQVVVDQLARFKAIADRTGIRISS